ncbi:MAG TPA: hypothetical protein VF960_09605, partial [Chloroflexota bacterium]
MDERFTESSTVIGVFDDAYQAERAISELSQLGFGDDHVEYSMSESSTIVGGYGTEEEPLLAGERSSRAVVRVACQGREQEVTDLLHRYGAVDVRTLGSDAPMLESHGTPRDSEHIDAETPRRVEDAGTYNVGMTGSGEVKTGTSSGKPVEDRPSDRWEDVRGDYRNRWQQRYGST